MKGKLVAKVYLNDFDLHVMVAPQPEISKIVFSLEGKCPTTDGKQIGLMK